MPLFAHYPALTLLETGETCVLLSEPAQRIRGKVTLRDPIFDDPVFICHETPHRRERLGWLFTSVSQEVLSEPILTPIFIREKSSEKKGNLQTVRYLRHAQALEVTYFPKTKEFHVFFCWNLFSPVKSGPPQTVPESQVSSFLSTYKRLPISWTLSLDSHEPHATQLVNPDPNFPEAVGDPPLDPGGAWPGIYNGFDPARLLSVGGAAWSKNLDPFQLSDAHKNLPESPGLMNSSLIQRKGALVDLGSIEGFLNDDTQHLYYQREIQASRMATPVLMEARGFLYNLIAEEETPASDDTVLTENYLVIGSTSLSPAILDEPYVGLNFVTIQDTTTLFPFGVSLPGFATLLPGEIGHQFQVSGGQDPYLWCLRRTRSSQSDPAHLPALPGPPSPPVAYPFDDQGNLLDPEPDFPEASSGGGLPPGLLLNKTGLLYGTPTQVGTFLFRLHVKDNHQLRGEATIRLVVLPSETNLPECAGKRGFPVIYKTTITEINIPGLLDHTKISSWRGQIQAVGGETGKYSFFLPTSHDPPRQQVPEINHSSVIQVGVSDGKISLSGLNSSNFSSVSGVWVFEIEAVEATRSGISDPGATCDRRAVCVTIGTTRIAGIPDSQSDIPDGVLPEGKYQPKSPERSYLILDPPQVVREFIQGKNLYLRGSPGFPLRPDLGGLNLSPGIVTSINPGFVNPVQVIGIKQDSLAPAQTYLDWSNSNPTDFFRDIYDRFDPVPVSPGPPAPPGSSSITGAQIDDLIPVGKRIRPLWPV